jgi:NitT/TauT family transport system permease protein
MSISVYRTAVITVRKRARPLLFVVALLMIWQILVEITNTPAYIIPTPPNILLKFVATLEPQLYHLSYTAMTTLVGLLIALVLGVLLALLVIYLPSLKGVVLPFLATFNGIPKVAIAPLFIIWFGLGIESKILLAFLLALFPIFVNSLTGLGEIENDLLDLSRLSGGNKYRIFIKVRLMNAVPYIADALKVAFPLALVGSIVGEFIGGNRGIGYLILSGQFSMDTELVFSALLSITIFTSLGIALISLFERTFLKWRPSRRTR